MSFSFLGKVEDILQYMCLVEVIGCTFILCLLGYYIIMVREIMIFYTNIYIYKISCKYILAKKNAKKNISDIYFVGMGK